ncbi:MAG: hypothetical protein K9H64_04975 [Bacteroidales bacterium]|nr:hypothetical protein [Bacteroidales bacterium]MCF8455190.1 hypothetical protein [Bacteroidales bacterium]
MESKWVLLIKNNIEKHKETVHKRDVRFFQFDQLVRIAERLDNFEKTCPECSGHKGVLEEISSSLTQYVNTSPSMKREFEKKTDRIKKHLKTAHQIIPVYFFLSLYSFLGLAIGAGVGVIAGLAFYSYFINIIVFSTIVGLTIGYILGSKKDWKVRLDKRLL